jgi:CheY-like chemotaxis protein
LVEDSDDSREMLKELLETLGHEVDVAADGPEAVDKLSQPGRDVALIDVGLPGIDGYEVAARVRALPEGGQIYLVALTGYGGPEVKARAAAAGFDLHMTKPVDIDRLTDVLAGIEIERARRPQLPG